MSQPDPSHRTSRAPRERAPAPRKRAPAPRERTVRLRAGAPVLTRGDGLVQVGSDPAHRVLLPDTASVRRLLQLLPFGVHTHAPPSSPEVLRVLEAAHLLVDTDEERLLAQARGATRVRVHAPTRWRGVADDLLRTAGLRVVGPGGSSPVDVTLLVTWGEPPRDGTDLLTSRDEPWLPVAVLEGRVRVGPFVVPGQSACLRCVDAHDAAADPWHQVPPAPAASSSSAAHEAPMLTRPTTVRSRRAGSRGDGPGGDGPGEPQDVAPPDAVAGLVLHHGLLTAATDVARWAEGRQPLTWSATRTHRDPMAVEHRAWTRHPHCGCSWGDELPTG